MKQDKISGRFKQLADEATTILQGVKRDHNDFGGADNIIDDQAYMKWRTSAGHLIGLVCGEASQHLARFRDAEGIGFARGYHECLKDALAVFQAAQDDFATGFLVSFRDIVEADVFDDELSQAEELLRNGYIAASAVIAGVVLETTLRRMCTDAELPLGNLNTLNAELAKGGVYNKLMLKNVTAWADIRNNAAHGRSDQFTKADVSTMILGVRNFVSEQLS